MSVYRDAYDPPLIETERTGVAREDDKIVSAGRERAGEVEARHQELAAEVGGDIGSRRARERGADEDGRDATDRQRPGVNCVRVGRIGGALT